ncbi:hypothetical protein [Streptomyces tremellae]
MLLVGLVVLVMAAAGTVYAVHDHPGLTEPVIVALGVVGALLALATFGQLRN